MISHPALCNLLGKLVPSYFFVQQTLYFFTQTSYFLTQTSYFFTQQITQWQCCVKNYAFQMFLRNAAYCGVVLRRIAILLKKSNPHRKCTIHLLFHGQCRKKRSPWRVAMQHQFTVYQMFDILPFYCGKYCGILSKLPFSMVIYTFLGGR